MDETRKTQGEEAHEETRSRKSKKKRSGIGGIVNAVLVIAVIGIIAFFAIKRLTKAPEELETRALPIVTLTSATTGSVEEQSAVMGTVNPSDTYYVMPKVAGELLEVYVENGQAVKQGDPIAKIDNQKQIDAAKSTLDAANASVTAAAQQAATAQDALNRMTPLYQAGDIAAQTYQQTKNSAEAAAAQVQAARAQAQAAQLQYDTNVEYSTVTAPADGIVQNQDMTVHAMVSQQSQLCIITGNGEKSIDFNVTDSILQNLHVGDAVVVSKGGTDYQGTITEIGSVAGAQTGMFTIKANLQNATTIPDGSSAKVTVVSGKADNALLVPVDCVYYSGGLPYVYIYNGETVKRVYITTGISDGTNYQVLDGLDGTEQIVGSWTEDLYDGATVRIADSTTTDVSGASIADAGDQSATAKSSAASEAASSETAANTETTAAQANA